MGVESVGTKNFEFIWVIIAAIIVMNLVQLCHVESQLIQKQHSKYNQSHNLYKKQIRSLASSNSNLPNVEINKLKKSNATKKNHTNKDQLSCNSTLIPLTKSQTQLCRLHKDHMPFVDQGAKITIEECQYQLRKNRWNCSTIRDVQPVFGPIIQTGQSRFTSTHQKWETNF